MRARRYDLSSKTARLARLHLPDFLRTFSRTFVKASFQGVLRLVNGELAISTAIGYYYTYIPVSYYRAGHRLNKFQTRRN
jgi:hypothetical protein